MRICVYGAASAAIDIDYIEKGELLGLKMSERGHSLVFGGGANGLMGAVSRGMRSGGGHIVGVLPRFFEKDAAEQLCDFCDELIHTDTMRERKQIMEDRSDAFIVTPGGIGTFEEFFEILTLKQLCRHNKPVAVYNLNGYYNELNIMMEQAIRKNFIRRSCLELFKLTDDLNELFEYIETSEKDVYTVKELKDG